METESIIAELSEVFGSASQLAHALDLELSRVQRWIDDPGSVTAVERSLLVLLHRANQLSILSLILVDDALLSPTDGRPPALSFVLSKAFQNLVRYQEDVIEIQRLVIEYYENKNGNA